MTKTVQPRSQLRAVAGDRRPVILAVVLARAHSPWAARRTSLKPEAETTRSSRCTWFGSELTFDAYALVLGTGGIVKWAINSAVTAVIVTFLTVRSRRWRRTASRAPSSAGAACCSALILAGIMVPPQVLIAPLFAEMVALQPGRHLVGHDPAAGRGARDGVHPVQVLPGRAAGAGGGGVRGRGGPLAGRSARSCCRCPARCSRRWRSSPSSRRGTTSSGRSWSPPTRTTMTLPVGLANVVQSTFGLRYAQIMASVVLAGLPLLVVFVFFQRQIIRGVAHTGLAGQ